MGSAKGKTEYDEIFLSALVYLYFIDSRSAWISTLISEESFSETILGILML
jgi:hypothetical protein